MEVHRSALKERMWAWAHKSDPEVFEQYGLRGVNPVSSMDPVVGADYLGLSNILMILPPAENDAEKVASFRRVVWQLRFGEDFSFEEELTVILGLSKKYSNIEGVILDDLTSIEICRRGMKPDTLARLCRHLHSNPRPLSLWGVLYTMNFDIPGLSDYMSLLDVVTLWTWDANDLYNLEANFRQCEKIVKGKPIMLGLYLYDYPGKRPMPLDLMKFQCDCALSLLREERIIGVNFEPTNGITDLGFESVEWLRDWINQVGDLLV